MIYIVCIIHVVYWHNIGGEPLRSLLLFEMPVIFFIAGASQTFSKNRHTLAQTIKNRTKRVIVPFYIFVIILPLWMLLLTIINPEETMYNTDIRNITPYHVKIILCTGGCGPIPFYGYSWFIIPYFLLSCSLPLQVKLLSHINKYIYISINILMVILLSFTTIPIGERVIKYIFVYNVFYIAGYLFYKQRVSTAVYAAAIASVGFTIYGFIDGTMMPMQDNKFPPNYHFLIFGIASIFILSMIFRRINIRYTNILKIWNERGYNIFLYQLIGAYITSQLVYRWVYDIDSILIQLIIVSSITFAINTALSSITYRYEKRMEGTIYSIFGFIRQKMWRK